MRLRNESVRREEVFAASAEDVWAALTDPERLADWFANEVDLPLEAGATGVFRWANGEERRAIVHEVVQGERLAFEWVGDDDVASTVELELEETDAGETRLVVTETSARAGTPPATEWSVAVGLGALARHLDPVLV